ncbi:MAG: GNAT family N-acetyltransferase [Defluviimonas sp.]|nr:GNAT family N-acetyltransferase [Defluviimonas sp.]
MTNAARPAYEGLAITRESPLGPDLALLMRRHAEAMHADTPPESIHMMDAAALDVPGIAFFVMREGGEPLAMGAFKRLSDPRHAEIKSMHVLHEARGRGLARVLLDHLLAEARAAGIVRLSLETGSQPSFAAARGLYARAGFGECPPFEGYGPDPNSVFMTRATIGRCDGQQPRGP